MFDFAGLADIESARSPLTARINALPATSSLRSLPQRPGSNASSPARSTIFLASQRLLVQQTGVRTVCISKIITICSASIHDPALTVRSTHLPTHPLPAAINRFVAGSALEKAITPIAARRPVHPRRGRLTLLLVEILGQTTPTRTSCSLETSPMQVGIICSTYILEEMLIKPGQNQVPAAPAGTSECRTPSCPRWAVQDDPTCPPNSDRGAAQVMEKSCHQELHPLLKGSAGI